MLRSLFHNGLFRTARALTRFSIHIPTRHFSLSAPILERPLPPRLKINDADLTISYLKGTGPGGQKIVLTLQNHLQGLENCG